jgi:hypothetical protein
MNQSKSEHPSYKETRWHLLRVDKNGGLKPFVYFRGLAMVVAGLVFVMAVCIGWLLIAWLDTKEALVTFQETAIRQKKAYESIHIEKESAFARLAIVESKLKALVSEPLVENQSNAPGLKNGQDVTAKTAPVPANIPEPPPEKAKAEIVKTPGTTPAPDDADMDTGMVKVVADNLFICANPADTKLNIEFKIINLGTRKQPVAGHVFVILKDAYAEQDKWLVVPGAMLMDGRPVQSKGQRFRIYNYRTIKFKVAHENPGLFVQATIFIFKHTGELIFERDFSLEPIRACT